MSSETVSLTIDGRTATISINHPPLNVLTIAVREALSSVIGELEARDDIAVVVIESALPSAFSVGSNVHEFPRDEAGGLAKIRFEQRLYDRIAALAPVTIGKARGLILGGGAELMLACDLRVASVDGEIGFPEIRLGALPAAGGMKRLLRELGPARARDMVLRGRRLTTTRAAEIGLLTEAVPAEALDRVVAEIVAELLALPSVAMTQAKRAFNAMQTGGDANAIEAAAFGALFRAPDLAEGLSAFVEKRLPQFNHKR